MFFLTVERKANKLLRSDKKVQVWEGTKEPVHT